LASISLIPNIQTKLLQSAAIPFRFLPKTLKIWIKDFQLTKDVMDECFHKTTQEFDQVSEKQMINWFSNHLTFSKLELISLCLI
jgi:transcription-repair coupling factor (superfamily II helicase)